MGEWKWGTFFLFFGVALVTTVLMKKGERYAYTPKGSIQKKYSSTGKLYFFCAYLILIILCLIRNVEMYPPYPGENSIDMQAYIYFFREGLSAGWDWKKILTLNQWEPLFYSVNLLIRAFTSNYHIYWFVLYSFFLFCLLLFVKDNFDKNMSYVVLPYFMSEYVYGMCALRSCMANAFCMLAFCAVKKKKWGQAVLLVFLAAGCHYTALLVLPAILIVYIGQHWKYYAREKSILGTVAVFSFFTIMIPIATTIILQTKYKNYVGAEMTIIGQMPIICCALLAIIFFRDIRIKYPQHFYSVYTVLYYIMILPLIVKFGIYRVGDLLLIPRLLVWTLIVEFIKGRMAKHLEKKMVCILAFAIMALWMLKKFYDMRGYGTMPYLNQWI